LSEKAQETEVTIPVNKSQERQYNLDPVSFFINRFWDTRPDGVVINETLRIVYNLDFKWSTDRDKFLKVKEVETNDNTKTSLVRSDHS